MANRTTPPYEGLEKEVSQNPIANIMAARNELNQAVASAEEAFAAVVHATAEDLLNLVGSVFSFKAKIVAKRDNGRSEVIAKNGSDLGWLDGEYHIFSVDITQNLMWVTNPEPEPEWVYAVEIASLREPTARASEYLSSGT